MLETRAVVVQIDDRGAMVQAGHGNGCGQCNGQGCGADKLSRLFCSKPRIFNADNPINASVGDEVIVSVAEGAVLRGVGLVYAFPLLLLVLGAVLGNNWAAHPGQRDVFAALGALSGLMIGFAFARWISSRHAGGNSRPYIARQWRKE